jgi:hypothetical protein
VTKELRREKAAAKTPRAKMLKGKTPRAKMQKMTKREEKLHAVGEEPKEVLEELEAPAVKRKRKEKMSAADSAKDLVVAEVVVAVEVVEEKEGLAEVKVKKVNGTPSPNWVD